MLTPQFNLIVSNHNDLRAIEDWIMTITGMLRVVGCDASCGDRFLPQMPNIILECFDESFIARCETALAQDCPIIILATEYITGETFNHFQSKRFPSFLEHALRWKHGRSILKRVSPERYYRYAGREQEFKNRYHNFLRVAKQARCIWVAEPRQVDPYQQRLGPGHRVVAFPYCAFEPCFAADGGSYQSVLEKRYDVFFSGSLTTYRKKILNELEAHGLSVLKLPPTTPLFMRNQFADQSRIILDLKQDPDWAYVSNLRLHYHLQRGDFVVSESRRYPSCLSKYVFSDNDSVVEVVQDLLLQKIDFLEIGHANRARFQQECSARQIMPNFLAQSGCINADATAVNA